MEPALSLIRQLCKEHFYGSLTLKFESGNIVILKKEETIKPQPPTVYSESEGLIDRNTRP